MTRLPVFYDDRMVARAASFSPSAEKPRAVVAAWHEAGLPIAIHPVEPATVAELARAHRLEFVRGVMEGRIANGFGNRSLEVAASLAFTSGAMLSAARWVLARGGSAAAPCSGFHHADWDAAYGFCTFNGLMVTACAVRSEGRARVIGILDCDHHDGDGTRAILDRLEAHAWVRHVTIGARWHRPEHAGAFLAALPGIVAEMSGCDLLLYQAGADPHLDDPLGGWLSSEELGRRDAMVFAGAKRLGVPLVWNLAGGYQRGANGDIGPVLAIHGRTAREWCAVYAEA